VSRGFAAQSEIEADVQRLAQALAPDVVRIRYSLGDDWTGDPSLFLKILLTDEASRPENLYGVVQRVPLAVMKEIDGDDLGLHLYWDFRSLSEQEELLDPAWA
jgi:hypothetical protein